jgi:hypothetical protein
MSEEKLAAFVDRELDRADSMLFTLTPREELDEVGRWQRLCDQAFAGQVRTIVAMHNRAVAADREFAGDEVALALGVGPVTGSQLVGQALALAELPGLVEAISAGLFTSRHALAVLRELQKVELSVEQRASIVLVVLARYVSQTPGELAVLTRRLILTVDRAAAQARQDLATGDRHVQIYPDTDGQGIVRARGPVERLAAVKAALAQWLKDNPKTADDPRTEQQREFDLFVALLTGGADAGAWQAQVIVPFHTTAGGELELAEIPGFGPILPSTAHDLLLDAESLMQVAVDETGTVIAAGDPITPDWDAALQQLASPPAERLRPENLSSDAYRTPGRLLRHVQARDRTCVFPGCHRRITDVDHRIPWPLGPTAADNLQLLCRHHHRAKQAVFTVELTEDGDYLWTSKGGWQFLRKRQGY